MGADDALSPVLETLRFRGGCFARTTLRAPWGIVFEHDLFAQKQRSDDIATFHALLRGRAVLSGPGQEPLCLEEGDVVYLKNAQDHALSSSDDVSPVTLSLAAAASDTEGGCRCLVQRFSENSGPETTMISGVVVYPQQPNIHPTLSILPDMISLPRPVDESRQRVDQVLSYLAVESRSARVASGALVVRLCEILFIEVVRFAIEEELVRRPSWFGGLKDERLSQALVAIHRSPGAPWTVASLARVAGMSRTNFARLFSSLVGEAPLSYLTRWRMHLAATALIEGERSLASIAADLGYRSEAAFSRAFSKTVGATPSAVRREGLTWGAPRAENSEPASPASPA